MPESSSIVEGVTKNQTSLERWVNALGLAFGSALYVLLKDVGVVKHVIYVTLILQFLQTGVFT